MADQALTLAPPPEKLALSVAETAAALSVSERQVYVMMERDGLPSIRLGGRRLVRVADLKQWLASQPAAVPAPKGDRHE